MTNKSNEYGYIGASPTQSSSANTGPSCCSTAGGGTGGSGVVILRYPNTFTITDDLASLTMSTATDGSDKVTTVTAGTGTVSFG